MNKIHVVYVKCTLSAGAFPSECIFRFPAPTGGVYDGVAPLHYCFDENRKRLTSELPSDQEQEGSVAGIEISRAGGVSRVELPNGELYEVSEPFIIRVEAATRVPV
ncbi:MAG: hypothetical protein ACRELG_29045 [Gemmataceae bacterium]